MDVRARLALAAFGVAAYAVVSHELMTRAADSPLALAVVLGPMLFALVATAWQLGQRLVAGLLAAACIVGAIASAQGEGVSPPLLYLAQHAGTYAALGFWFGSTLRPGREALISRLAARVHGAAYSAGMRRYTRQLTRAWAVYFIVIAALSCGLFAFAPFARWSLFANVITPVSLGLMFVGEYLLRYRLHPEFERVDFATAIRAFSAKDASAAMDPRR
jgi:uncharacterized membrane protein